MDCIDVELASISRTLVGVTGQLARFCDRSEHNEGAERTIPINSGQTLRTAALRLLVSRGIDPVEAYSARLAALEARHPLAGSGLFEARECLANVRTWRELQQAQARHDAVYHPDVNGLPKIDQIKHYTLHLSKLTWLLQAGSEGEISATNVYEDRVPDVLVFGVKLATVCGQLLPDDQIDQQT